MCLWRKTKLTVHSEMYVKQRISVKTLLYNARMAFCTGTKKHHWITKKTKATGRSLIRLCWQKKLLHYVSITPLFSMILSWNSSRPAYLKNHSTETALARPYNDVLCGRKQNILNLVLTTSPELIEELEIHQPIGGSIIAPLNSSWNLNISDLSEAVGLFTIIALQIGLVYGTISTTFSGTAYISWILLMKSGTFGNLYFFKHLILTFQINN